MLTSISAKESRVSIGGVSTVSEPKTSPRSIRTPNHPGRKLVANPPSAHLLVKKDSSKIKPKTTENATIEELDHMLEEDALVLLNMKKEINKSQNEELEKLKVSVLAIKKEYDSIFVANNMKEVQLKSLQDSEAALAGVEKAAYSSSAEVNQLAQSLQEQSEIVNEEYEAEQRTTKMLTLMIKRLDKEVAQCRIDTSKAVVAVDHAKHDLQITEVSASANRQELLDQEAQLEKLNSALKARKQQREQKINMLHNLSAEGESSVARLQNTINENTLVSEFRYRFLVILRILFNFTFSCCDCSVLVELLEEGAKTSSKRHEVWLHEKAKKMTMKLILRIIMDTSFLWSRYKCVFD
jgi:hypothetical protein